MYSIYSNKDVVKEYRKKSSSEIFQEILHLWVGYVTQQCQSKSARITGLQFDVT